jgi:hypothetical protein
MTSDTKPPIPLIPYAMTERLSDEHLLELWDEELRDLEVAFEQGTSAAHPLVQSGDHLRVVHVREDAFDLVH